MKTLTLALTLLIPSALAPSAAAQPAEAEAPWHALGPEGAAVSELVSSPSAPGVVRAVAGEGGVYRSVDAGASWRAANGGLEALSVVSVAVDPVDSTKLFAATTDGLWVTTDGGGTWERTSLPRPRPNPPNRVELVVVAPSDPNVVYAATVDDVWRSVDGGGTWQRTADTLPRRTPGMLEVHPEDPATAWVSFRSAGLFRTTDGGAVWQRIQDGIDLTKYGVTVEDLAYAPSDLDTLYAGVEQAANLIGVFKSTDGGDTWVHVGVRLTGEVAWEPPAAVAVDPGSADRVIVGGTWGLFRTTDGGGTWQPAALPRTPLGSRNVLSAAWFPFSGGTLLVGTEEGGIFRSTDGGATWRESNRGLDARPVGLWYFERVGQLDRQHPGLVADPRGNGRLYVVSRDHRLYASDDWGGSWQRLDPRLDPGGGGGGAVVVDLRLVPARPDVLFARAWFRPTPTEPTLEALFRSRDAGRTWMRVGEGLPRAGLPPLRTYGPLHWDPSDPGALYLQPGADRPGGEIYRSTDDGATWRIHRDSLPSDQGIVAPLDQIAPAGGDRLFAWLESPGEKPCHGLGCPPAPLERHMYTSRNGGASWTELPAVLTATERWFQDDRKPSVLYAVSDGGDLLRSTDGGASFSFYVRTPYEPLGERPRDGWPVDEIADPAANGTRYRVRWQAPVQRSTDGGTTWERFGEELVPYDAEGLVLVPSQGGGPRVLLVTTDAGVWATRLDGGVFPPPPGGPLTTEELPDFRFWFRISAGPVSDIPVRREEACLPETLCVSGAVPGRIEVLARIVGPKPNGFLWPTLVKFTTSEVDVWIERVSTGEMRHYTLRGARPGVDELPGLFDRNGFFFGLPPG